MFPSLKSCRWLPFALRIKSRLCDVTYKIFYNPASAGSLVFSTSSLTPATLNFSLPLSPLLLSLCLVQSCSLSTLCVRLVPILPRSLPTHHAACTVSSQCPVPQSPLWHTVLSSAWLYSPLEYQLLEGRSQVCVISICILVPGTWKYLPE